MAASTAAASFSKTTGRFTRYRKSEGSAAGPSSNSIDAIAEDSYGNLWLGTVSSGLDCFNRTTGQ